MKISAGAIIESAGQVLLAHPTEVYGTNNKWTIPKGEVETGEAIWEAMVREVAEETSFDILNYPFLQWDYEPTGSFKVGKDKLAYWFRVKDLSNSLQSVAFECMSFFHPFDDRPDFLQPELDKFAWYTPEQARMIVCNSQVHLFS